MTKYRKIGAPVEAWRVDFKATEPDWVQGALQRGAVYYRGGSTPYLTVDPRHHLDGPLKTREGDWLIRFPDGVFSVRSDAEFRAEYISDDLTKMREAMVPGLDKLDAERANDYRHRTRPASWSEKEVAMGEPAEKYPGVFAEVADFAPSAVETRHVAMALAIRADRQGRFLLCRPLSFQPRTS